MSDVPCCMAAAHDQACDCKKRDTLEARICEQRDLLEECEQLLLALGHELQELGGSQAGLTAIDDTLVKLRSQDKADE